MNDTRGVFVLLALLLLPQPAPAEWQASPDDKIQLKAERAIATTRERVPQSSEYFEDAYAYVVFPSVTRVALGFGGAYGKGVMIVAGEATGTSRYSQFSSGIQAGAKSFSMILFFKDQEAAEQFQAGDIQLMGQAGLSLGTFGVAGTPTYSEGVAVVTVTRLGLIAEFSISGARFRYKPY